MSEGASSGREGSRRTVLSVEQALSMPYATLRFVQLGWRVIRIEPVPVPGRKSRGDPNRYIGRPVAGEDRHSYYVAPNVGKEAIALDLKSEGGQRALRKLIRGLGVSVFCTNTMPARHAKLGIDFESLHAEFPALVWASISAMGTAYADVPGYDPATQALCGYMDLTGHKDGPPLQCGPPIIDLKAGDEVFAQVLLALLEQQEHGKGKKIDVSMAHAAVSWLQTFLPMLDMGSPPEELRRHGNEHRQFIPVGAYRTQDGWIYIAIGSDAQWERFTREPIFASLASEERQSNEGRRKGKDELHAEIEALTKKHPSERLARCLAAAAIPHAPVHRIEEVAQLDFVRESALTTRTPTGQRVQLPPAALRSEFLEERGGELPFAPSYGEHTRSLLEEVGESPAEVDRLIAEGSIYCP